MPFDDGDDDDAPVFGAPPAPDDRLWRHPSELGGTAPAAASAAPTTVKPLRLWGVAVVSGLIGAALTVGVVAAAGGLQTANGERPAVEKVAVTPANTLASFNDDGVVGVTHTVSPAIVKLQVARSNGSTIGTGVLYRNDGYLITNAHVVEGAVAVVAVLDDGTDLDAAVVGRDAWTDVAVLKVDRHDLPTATIGSADRLQIGEQAIAIGAPLTVGGGPSVTVGVLSARGRRVTSTGGWSLHEMLATDAPIADEASGGALVDRAGVVVGLNTVVANDGASTTGLGFATPIEVAVSVADDIISTGHAHHVWLGVDGDDLLPLRARELKLDGGAVVLRVMDSSPAAAAGLKNGDIITAINGERVTSLSSLVTTLRNHAPGEEVTIDYVRNGEAQTCKASLIEKEAP